MNLEQNFFELFDLPIVFEVDQQQLSQQYRQLLKLTHPDRFAGADERQQRLAVQYAAQINQGYDTLRKPLPRALYLLTLAGHDIDMERNTVMDTAFLMEQMMWRDEMSDITDSADPEQALGALMDKVSRRMKQDFATFEQYWQAGDEAALLKAGDVIRKLQFMVKLQAELLQLEARLLGE